MKGKRKRTRATECEPSEAADVVEACRGEREEGSKVGDAERQGKAVSLPARDAKDGGGCGA